MAEVDCVALDGDGKVGDSNGTWNTIHDATTGTATDTETTEYVIAGNNAGTYVIYRMFIPIDTSTIPTDGTITAASLFFKSGATVSGDDQIVGLVQTDQASVTALVNDDFNNCGAVDSPTEGTDSRVTIAATETWYELVLNATGRGWIVQDGANPTKFGIRGAADLDDSAPSDYHYANVHMSEAVEANRPYLKVTYTEAGGASTSDFFQLFN
jgi:hypothetical protein